MQSGSMKGQEDDDTPEYLLPVKDPYTSDDDNKMLVTTNTNKAAKRKRKSTEKETILPKYTHSSKLKATEVLFLFDLDYAIQPADPVDLTRCPSVEIILEHMFRFIDNVPEKQLGYIRNSKTIPELYKTIGEKCSAFKWMTENDDLNLKNCTDEQKLKKQNLFAEIRSRLADGYNMGDSMKNVMLFIETMMTLCTVNGFNSSDKHVKSLFRHLGQLVPFTAYHRYDTEASYTLRYYVSPDLVSDLSHSSTQGIYEDRDCHITVCPHFVYEANKVAKIAVQIYSQSDESSPIISENEEKSKSKRSYENPVQKPERKINAILSKEYQHTAQAYLKQFIPQDIADDEHCVNKILGEHVVQLISLAFDNKIKGHKQECLGNNENKNPKHEIVGIFMRNEYIYFSKLSINEDKLNSYSPQVLRLFPSESNTGYGCVHYGNWRLDLTLAKHRIAFVAFMIEFLRQ